MRRAAPAAARPLEPQIPCIAPAEPPGGAPPSPRRRWRRSGGAPASLTFTAERVWTGATEAAAICAGSRAGAGARQRVRASRERIDPRPLLAPTNTHGRLHLELPDCRSPNSHQTKGLAPPLTAVLILPPWPGQGAHVLETLLTCAAATQPASPSLCGACGGTQRRTCGRRRPWPAGTGCPGQSNVRSSMLPSRFWDHSELASRPPTLGGRRPTCAAGCRRRLPTVQGSACLLGCSRCAAQHSLYAEGTCVVMQSFKAGAGHAGGPRLHCCST